MQIFRLHATHAAPLVAAGPRTTLTDSFSTSCLLRVPIRWPIQRNLDGEVALHAARQSTAHLVIGIWICICHLVCRSVHCAASSGRAAPPDAA